MKENLSARFKRVVTETADYLRTNQTAHPFQIVGLLANSQFVDEPAFYEDGAFIAVKTGNVKIPSFFTLLYATALANAKGKCLLNKQVTDVQKLDMYLVEKELSSVSRHIPVNGSTPVILFSPESGRESIELDYFVSDIEDVSVISLVDDLSDFIFEQGEEYKRFFNALSFEPTIPAKKNLALEVDIAEKEELYSIHVHAPGTIFKVTEPYLALGREVRYRFTFDVNASYFTLTNENVDSVMTYFHKAIVNSFNFFLATYGSYIEGSQITLTRDESNNIATVKVVSEITVTDNNILKLAKQIEKLMNVTYHGFFKSMISKITETG